MKTLATLVDGADERRPTEQKLSRQLAASKGSWESYDKAHFAHLAMLEAELWWGVAAKMITNKDELSSSLTQRSHLYLQRCCQKSLP